MDGYDGLVVEPYNINRMKRIREIPIILDNPV